MQAGAEQSTELSELRDLMELKELYDWADDDKAFLARKKAIQKKYMAKIKEDSRAVKGEGGKSGGFKRRRVYLWGKKAGLREEKIKTPAVFPDDAVKALKKWRAGDWHPPRDGSSRGTGDVRMFHLVSMGIKYMARVQKTPDSLLIQEGCLRDEEGGEEEEEDEGGGEDDDDPAEKQPKKKPTPAPPKPAKEAKGAGKGKKKKADDEPAMEMAPVVEETRSKRERKQAKKHE